MKPCGHHKSPSTLPESSESVTITAARRTTILEYAGISEAFLQERLNLDLPMTNPVNNDLQSRVSIALDTQLVGMFQVRGSGIACYIIRTRFSKLLMLLLEP